MRRTRYIAMSVLGFIVIVGFYNPVEALDTTFSQEIIGTHNCNLDEVYSGLHPEYIFVPEECSEHLPDPNTIVPSTLAPKNSRTLPVNNDNSTLRRDGDQTIFENTVMEPLASWVGIGNAKASSANPAIATITLGTGTGIAVDAALFQLQYSQRIIGFGRRRLKATSAALSRLFFRV